MIIRHFNSDSNAIDKSMSVIKKYDSFYADKYEVKVTPEGDSITAVCNAETNDKGFDGWVEYTKDEFGISDYETGGQVNRDMVNMAREILEVSGADSVRLQKCLTSNKDTEDEDNKEFEEPTDI